MAMATPGDHGNANQAGATGGMQRHGSDSAAFIRKGKPQRFGGLNRRIVRRRVAGAQAGAPAALDREISRLGIPVAAPKGNASERQEHPAELVAAEVLHGIMPWVRRWRRYAPAPRAGDPVAPTRRPCRDDVDWVRRVIGFHGDAHDPQVLALLTDGTRQGPTYTAWRGRSGANGVWNFNLQFWRDAEHSPARHVGALMDHAVTFDVYNASAPASTRDGYGGAAWNLNRVPAACSGCRGRSQALRGVLASAGHPAAIHLTRLLLQLAGQVGSEIMERRAARSV